MHVLSSKILRGEQLYGILVRDRRGVVGWILNSDVGAEYTQEEGYKQGRWSRQEALSHARMMALKPSSIAANLEYGVVPAIDGPAVWPVVKRWGVVLCPHKHKTPFKDVFGRPDLDVPGPKDCQVCLVEAGVLHKPVLPEIALSTAHACASCVRLTQQRDDYVKGAAAALRMQEKADQARMKVADDAQAKVDAMRRERDAARAEAAALALELARSERLLRSSKHSQSRRGR
jgi:hypothetical protein